MGFSCCRRVNEYEHGQSLSITVLGIDGLAGSYQLQIHNFWRLRVRHAVESSLANVRAPVTARLENCWHCADILHLQHVIGDLFV